MEIKLQNITVRELVENYENNDVENGVIGYGGKLNIRPKYQREYVYDDKQKREAYERQKGICPKCTPPNNHYEINEMEADNT